MKIAGISDAPALAESAAVEGAPQALAADKMTGARLTDRHGRAITDLRVSVTDRCNYRCVYCRTGAGGSLYGELPLDDYARMVQMFVSLGIEKVRLTGGEPLLRSGLSRLIGQIADMRPAFNPDTPLDIALTTNGHLLAGMAHEFRAAGLTRVTVSMDALDPGTFGRVTRVSGGLAKVRAGIRAAQDVGLGPVKVNCVLLRGVNDDQIEAFAEFSRSEGVIVRFIEWMPLGEDRTWNHDAVVPLNEIVARLGAVRPLVELPPTHRSETARRYTFADGRGEIGIIAPVSQPFCGHCSRIRLTSDGKIRTCLFSHFEHDLLGPMRRGDTDDRLHAFIQRVVDQKEARHHIGEAEFLKPIRNMVQIGG